MTSPHSPLLELSKISKIFTRGRQYLYALDSIDLIIDTNKVVGLVGESGCGKSTLAKVIIQLEPPSSGELFFQGHNSKKFSKTQKRALSKQIQMVFQDPYSSLNPRMSIEDIVGEGIDIHGLAEGEERKAKILTLLNEMELPEDTLHRYPNEFSGGQRQRINIARALAVDPLLVVCDEPLSALDSCTQRKVMKLLIDLKNQRQLAYLFISHDLNAVRAIADTVIVMYLGKIIEKAPTARLFAVPAHPYTKALISAIPIADPEKEKQRSRLRIIGDPPSPLNPPPGCPFHPRCPEALPICSQRAPLMRRISEGHTVACHLWETVPKELASV